MLFLSMSLDRARTSTDHLFFLSPDFDESYLCTLSLPLLLSSRYKDACPFDFFIYICPSVSTLS